jgi:RNA polymerase sigma-70 factor, ECF subfamily
MLDLPNADAPDQPALLARARALDRQALTELYDLYNEGLYYYALRLCGDEAVSEDCVTETFSRLMQAFKAQQGPRENIKGYLFRTAHNWVMDRYRRQPVMTPIDDEVLLADDDELPDEIAIRTFSATAVRGAFAQLTSDQQQVVSLKFLEGWTNDEIARALGKPVGAVKSLQHRALGTLRRTLEGRV